MVKVDFLILGEAYGVLYLGLDSCCSIKYRVLSIIAYVWFLSLTTNVSYYPDFQ